MSEADANITQNAQSNADASNASGSKKARQNISNDTKKVIVVGINGETNIESKRWNVSILIQISNK